LDMTQVLVELRRVLVDDGRVVIVLGRESTVRGITFENGRLFSELVQRDGSFKLERRLERSFVNRFGKRIFEDVLELAPTNAGSNLPAGRLVGVEFLSRALHGQIDRRQIGIGLPRRYGCEFWHYICCGCGAAMAEPAGGRSGGNP